MNLYNDLQGGKMLENLIDQNHSQIIQLHEKSNCFFIQLISLNYNLRSDDERKTSENFPFPKLD